MDPNLLQAALHSCQVSSEKREWHLEREMAAYKPTETRPRHSWAMAVRRRAGAGLVLLGECLRGTPPLVHPDQLTEPVSTP